MWSWNIETISLTFIFFAAIIWSELHKISKTLQGCLNALEDIKDSSKG